MTRPTGTQPPPLRTGLIAAALVLFLSPAVTWPAIRSQLGTEAAPAASVHLGGYRGDPAADPVLKSAADRSHRLRLVQLEGLVQDGWRSRLEAQGLQVLAYVPNNAYLVWSTVPAPDAVARLDATPFVRWHGAVPLAAKRQPTATPARPDAELMVLHVAEIGVADLPTLVASLGGVVTRSNSAQPNGRLWLTFLRLDTERIPTLAAMDGVVWIEPAPGRAVLNGEMSSLVVSGSFDTTSPAPGYRAWLDNLGYDGTGVLWAVVDSGVDPLHPDLAGVYGISYPGCETDLPGDDPGVSGHGTPVASIIAGTAAAGFTDPDGFLWGLGVAPGAGLISQNAVCGDQNSWPPVGGWQILSRDGLLAGSVGSSNSWNSQEGVGHGYQASERVLDLMVRDGNFDTPGVAEPYIMVFNATNEGPEPSTIGAPVEAKNLITVGAIDNWRTVGNIHTVVEYSARGPTFDGRMFPTVVAPGRGVGAAEHRLQGFIGRIWEIPDTDGLYISFEGTSAATPHVSGMLAVTTEWWRATRSTDAPSPAAARALVVNAALPLDDDQTVPNFESGWGLANLERMVASDTQLWIVDQTELLADTASSWQHEAEVADPSQPLRITLAWTDDAAAAGADPALVNDLDLTVTTGGVTYLGNHIENGWSTPGGDADHLNTLEDVHIATPGGVAVITVTVANLPGDGVPYNGDPTDQDFAIVCRNCRVPPPAPRHVTGRVTP